MTRPGSALTRPVEVPTVVKAWAKAWNEADAAGMAALFTEDGLYEDYAFQAHWTGVAGVSQWVALTVANIPDARVEVLDAYQIEDRATIRWIFHGTPERLADIPGTGRSFAVSAVTLIELEGGLIRRLGDFYNLANLLRQLDLPSGIWSPPFGPDILK